MRLGCWRVVRARNFACKERRMLQRHAVSGRGAPSEFCSQSRIEGTLCAWPSLKREMQGLLEPLLPSSSNRWEFGPARSSTLGEIAKNRKDLRAEAMRAGGIRLTAIFCKCRFLSSAQGICFRVWISLQDAGKTLGHQGKATWLRRPLTSKLPYWPQQVGKHWPSCTT